MSRSERWYVDGLKRYRDRYRVEKGGDGVWAIPCKHGGNIVPHSEVEMSCYLEFGARSGVRIFKGRMPGYCKVEQEGDEFLVFRFPVTELEEVGELVGARKRRRISAEHRARLVRSVAVARTKKRLVTQRVSA